MSLRDEVYQAADILRAIANEGRQFATSGYDQERYARVLEVSARLVAALENRNAAEVMSEYEGDLGHASPHAGVDLAVFKGDKVLLIKRKDNGLWGLPGGHVEVGETLAEAATREFFEEAGVAARVVSLLAVLDSRLWHSSVRQHLYHHIFLGDIGDAMPHTVGALNHEDSATGETLDAQYFSERDLPELHAGHRDWLPLVFKLYRGEVRAPYLDGVESSP